MSSHSNRLSTVPSPINEPIRSYGPGSEEKKSIKSMLKSMASEKIDIPCIIGGKEVRTGKTATVVMPHRHRHVIAEYHLAGAEELKQAAASAVRAQQEWEKLSWQDRAGVFLKAADLLAGPYRDILNASTMLGQSKNVYQAEIDSACELIDFFRFNAAFYQEILENQPFSPEFQWNQLDYRALEGFIVAITPFNFTSIAGNLPSAPALCGNACVWKPSRTQVHSAYWIMKLFEDAGLPAGVINFVPSEGRVVGETLLTDPNLAGVHFTGSTSVFQNIWSTIGKNISNFHSYPRIVGETGGKDFIFAHPSANGDELRTALIRGAFEYQGQKCSAASRAYIPKSLWNSLQESLVEELKSITLGDVDDFTHFMNAVIDESSFDKISNYIETAKNSSDAKILFGGGASKSEGYFIEPTVIVATDPKFVTMREEIFGPVLSIYVYEDNSLNEALDLCDQTSPYALTGAIFGRDKAALNDMSDRLRYAAGNFYINDKPTGAVVGQQPFGGGRASGTNDKAGSVLNLYRWISPRNIKENFLPPREYRYPFLEEK